MADELRVEIAPGESVAALLYAAAAPKRAGITLVLAHGAGAGQSSPFMVTFATALAARGIAIVTFNFAYVERGRRIPDPNERLEACWRAVIGMVREHPTLGRDKLAIGGKSMGGRIASQVAAGGVGGLHGLVLLGYPLHPPGKPHQLRVRHLPQVPAPMLFIQGSRDAFGTPEELRPILATLKAPATLYVVEGGDHSFKLPKSAGRTQADVMKAVQERIDAWLRDPIAG
jgi:uncharacterized protein